MSIQHKLLLAFSVVLALATGVAVYGIHAISEAGGLVVRLYDQPFMAVSHAREAQADFNEARAAMERGLSLREAAPESNSAALEASMHEVMEELKVVRERSAAPSAAAAVVEAEALAQDWYRTGLQIIKPPAGGLTQLPLATAVSRQADQVAAAIDQIAESASAHGFEFRSQAEAEVAASKSGLVTLAVVTGMIGILLSFGIALSFGRAIRNATAISERIAAGDLSEKVSTSRRDELGRLIVSLGRMQEALRTQAEAQRSAAESKDRDHAEQIARRQRIEQQIAEFRGSVEKMLEQAGEMIGRMNATARTLLAISKEADSRANDATGAAEETSSNVTIVAASTEQLGVSVRAIIGRLASATGIVIRASDMARATNEMITGLAQSTEQIDDVVGLIRSIADQTNLLALNATIEAARAGTAGRGFAVVASEVKALATQTAKATGDISGQISDVQSSTSHMVERIKSIAEIMMEISAATMEITEAVRQQGIATEAIAFNIQGAASATQNVARNVAGTTSAIGEASRAAAEVLEAAEYMTSHAGDLNTSVDKFLRDVAAA
jgi:methyl-accepting chemotaxis protein